MPYFVSSAARSAAATAGPGRVLLASPRGYCAGADRAVVTVEKALDRYGPPVYVRQQTVRNAHVVRALERRGAVFVGRPTKCPRARWWSARSMGPPSRSTPRRRGAGSPP
ncbi:4-hydroxy-3-methylbut-2-enyl diphosphate reductase 2 [Streptomyces rimosus subsp. rimosus]